MMSCEATNIPGAQLFWSQNEPNTGQTAKHNFMAVGLEHRGQGSLCQDRHLSPWAPSKTINHVITCYCIKEIKGMWVFHSIPFISNQKATSLGCLRYSTISPWIKYLGPCQLCLVGQVPLANNLYLDNCCHWHLNSFQLGLKSSQKNTNAHTQAHKTAKRKKQKNCSSCASELIVSAFGKFKAHNSWKHLSAVELSTSRSWKGSVVRESVHVAHCCSQEHWMYIECIIMYH